jgi:hypothetical protein
VLFRSGGVIQLMQCEETVIRKYEQAGLWRHQRVMFFVLRDLQPLMRQVQQKPGMTPGRIADIQNQPATVLYDLKSLSECSVYINRQASERAGYWHDLVAMQGLLVHEHAHPVAENDTVRASRRLNLELTGAGDERLDRVMTDLARVLSLYAPRELFANETALRAGFGDVMLHLDQRLITDASRSLAGRATLLHQLGDAVSRQAITQTAAKVLLLAGDMQMCLPLAIEVAPFYRAGANQLARQLETLLTTTLCPALGLRVERTYRALCDAYINLSSNQTADTLMNWCSSVLTIVADSLTESGYVLQFRLQKEDD